jgi:formylglycine-generating enzyme required for sulfatase activity
MVKYTYFIFIALVLPVLNGTAQVKEFSASGIEKVFTKVKDSLYASRYETSNAEYNQFLDAIGKKDASLYKQHYPDTAAWFDLGFENKSMAEYYHRHKGFRDYPVLCISYEGAMAYCEWLTEHYNNSPQRTFNKVRFVLPTEQEWELAATANHPSDIYPWGTYSMRETRKGAWQGAFLANFKRAGDVSIVTGKDGQPVFLSDNEQVQIGNVAGGLNDRAFYTAPVNSFFPNKFGIYNQGGNAAEMTTQKGLTKGGSWNSYGGELQIKYRLFFPQPSAEVGFRVFMKIVEQ